MLNGERLTIVGYNSPRQTVVAGEAVAGKKLAAPEVGGIKMAELERLAARLHAEGLRREGFALALDGRTFRIDLAGLTGGKRVMV